MKKIIYIATAVITMLSASICNAQTKTNDQATEEPAFKTLSIEEFETIIQDENVIRLDVRSAEEYAEGHIEGTLNIDVLKSTFKKTATETLDKEKTIALYCRSGKRSKTAAGMLSKSGYTVVELDGGFNAWVEAEKPVVK